jgi:hypothetical protein
MWFVRVHFFRINACLESFTLYKLDDKIQDSALEFFSLCRDGKENPKIYSNVVVLPWRANNSNFGSSGI